MAVLLLGMGGVVAWLRVRGPSVLVTHPARKDIEQHVVASGRVWVPTRVSVSAQVPGLVVAVGAVEGQHVGAGDLLLQTDDAEARAALAQAEAAAEQAEARVEQLRKVGRIVATETYRQAQTNLERATSDLTRMLKLAESGAVTARELDEARRQVDLARAQKSAADAQQVSAAPLGPDTRLAWSARMQSQAQLTAAKVRLEQTRIVARQAGVILSRAVEPGDVVQPGRTLFVLAADGDTQLVMTPDERNLAWIHVGQPARASADAFPGQVFDAQVSYIAPSIDTQRGSVEVRLRVARPPAFLMPDMTVSIDLTVATKAQVLTLPSDAIRGAATAEPWVLVVEGDRLARRSVRVGIRGEGSTELVSGLAASAQVLVAESRDGRIGQRVRPQLEAR